MNESIVQAIASILAYLSVRGIDKTLGKWAAFISIAWEKVASQKALEQFWNTRNDLASSTPEKWNEWEKWRNSTKL